MDTKLAKLYDKLGALEAKAADVRDEIDRERARLARSVEVAKIGTAGKSMYLTLGKRKVRVAKNRHGGWEVFEGRKKIWYDIRCSLYDLKVSLVNGGI